MSECIGADVVSTGWRLLIKRLLADIDLVLRDSDAKLFIRQIKEKIGSLRFYLRLENSSPEQRQEVDRLVALAVEDSQAICIICGAPGCARTHVTGFIPPVCKEHIESDLGERR